jgi:hypothetical protein
VVVMAVRGVEEVVQLLGLEVGFVVGNDQVV